MIIAAAINYEGVIFTGVRHYEILAYIKRLPRIYEKRLLEQGFIDHRNNYYDRVRAKKEVIQCGQYYVPLSSTLTSEDLW